GGVLNDVAGVGDGEIRTGTTCGRRGPQRLVTARVDDQVAIGRLEYGARPGLRRLRVPHNRERVGTAQAEVTVRAREQPAGAVGREHGLTRSERRPSAERRVPGAKARRPEI